MSASNAGLVTKPATSGTAFSVKLGRKQQLRKAEEMPRIDPLCKRRPNEPLKSSRAPSVVWTGVNIPMIWKGGPLQC